MKRLYTHLTPMRIAWTGAIAAAVLVLAVLLVFKGLRTTVIEIGIAERQEELKGLRKKRPPVQRREPTPQQVREISRRIAEKKQTEIRKHVVVLEEVERRMEELKRERIGEAPKIAPEEIRNALKTKLREESAKLERITRETRDTTLERDAAELKSLADKLPEMTPENSQAEGNELQEIARKAAAVADSAAARLSEKAEERENSQASAKQTDKAVEALKERIEASNVAIKKADADLASARGDLKKSERAVQNDQRAAERLARDLEKSKQVARKLEQEAAAARAKLSSDPAKEKKEKGEIARIEKQHEGARSKVAATAAQMEQAEKKTGNTRQSVEAGKAHLQESQAKLAELQDAKKRAEASLREAQAHLSKSVSTGGAEFAAVKLQAETVERVAGALEQEVKAGEAGDPASENAAAETPDEPSTVADLYEKARDLEESIRQDFAVARAAELAAIQGKSFEQAFQETHIPQGHFPDLKTELADVPADSYEEFKKLDAAMDAAVASAQQMALGAQAALRQAEGLGGRSAEDSGEGGSVADAARVQQAVQTAISNAQNRAVIDLTGIMRQSSGGGADGGTGGGEARSVATLGADAQGEKPSRRPSTLILDQKKVAAEALPGRKLSSTSKRTGWVFIDTWYVIGPFQRTGSWNDVYPPETIVDLDATYTGKAYKGRVIPVKWRFHQSNTIRITPPDEVDNSIYYAYTEIFSDEEREVLVAVASDDAAKVWINDLAIWEDTGLSGWKIDEGFRKIVLRQGVNRVLVRIENVPRYCEYSLLLCPVEAAYGPSRVR